MSLTFFEIISSSKDLILKKQKKKKKVTYSYVYNTTIL